MSYALQKCSMCGKEFVGPLGSCPFCNYHFQLQTVESISTATSISGQTYAPSSGTTTYSPSFEELSDAFDKDSQKENAKKTREELLWKREYLDEPDILLYLNWGYLKQDDEGYYMLTDLGRKTFRQNRKFKEEIEKEEDSENAG